MSAGSKSPCESPREKPANKEGGNKDEETKSKIKIEDLLSDLRLSEYIELFEEKKVTLLKLLQYDGEEQKKYLTDLGMKPGHRLKLTRNLKEHKEELLEKKKEQESRKTAFVKAMDSMFVPAAQEGRAEAEGGQEGNHQQVACEQQ
mmetsp:Transcript_35489/g.57038  ORF Transcript_35489/g.57038 Transcript_35489/m.57038 type:complete len:146 (+) Transcript_35489:78-515(+)|eukprot:jgi/Bigna1/86899/estExt_fgenesh1_pg.C_140251